MDRYIHHSCWSGDGSLEVSVIITCYNEEKNLPKAYKSIRKFLPKAEIIIFDDNSKDNTYKIAKEITNKDKNVSLIHTRHRLGRGKSLNLAIKKAKNNYVFYTDADLATPISEIKKMVYWLERGYSIVTCSRYLPNSKARRTFLRKAMSVVFNSLLKLTGTKLKDHQCGFKGFNKKDVIKIIPYVKNNHWFWDSELLIKAQAAGLKVKEIPVRWKEGKDTKVRVIKDSYTMGKEIFRLLIERATKKNWPKKE